ncbi:hypothetical protein, partial [Pseudoalteromonas sp. BZK2]|uniref:hypothetical protein n=1 Tax=Pseudoalteromonas sp. BZK2 TaxID=1904458 RepID=UPI001CA4460A
FDMYGFLIGKSNCPISLYRTHPIWGRSPYISYMHYQQTTQFGSKLTAKSRRLLELKTGIEDKTKF